VAGAASVSYRPIALGTFPSPVRAALAYLRGRTNVPIEGPTAVPTGLSVQVRTGTQHYLATLYHCPSVEALNSPRIEGPSCDGLARLFGTFGGQRFGSPRAARSALLHDESSTPFGCPQVRPATTQRLQLGGSIAVSVKSSGSTVCSVGWKDGLWSIVVVGTFFGSPRSEAESVLEQLGTLPLTGSSAELLIDSAGDGDHTEASWVQGKDLYLASAYHSETSAVSLANTMSLLLLARADR
jgi:hypothetical protein